MLSRPPKTISIDQTLPYIISNFQVTRYQTVHSLYSSLFNVSEFF